MIMIMHADALHSCIYLISFVNHTCMHDFHRHKIYIHMYTHDCTCFISYFQMLLDEKLPCTAYILMLSNHMLLPKIRQHNSCNMELPKVNNTGKQPASHSNSHHHTIYNYCNILNFLSCYKLPQ